MKNIIISLSVAMTLLTGSCTKKEVADLVILNGKVLTINKENPSAEAIAMKGELIIAVGSTEEISGYITEGTTKVIDAGGRLVIPVDYNDHQKMIVVTRNDETNFDLENFGDFAFVPLLKGTN